MASHDLALPMRDDALAVGSALILRHDRKWFHGSSFQSAESHHRRLIGRVAGEVKAADPFHGDDAAFTEDLPRTGDGSAASGSALHQISTASGPALHQVHFRSAVIAADRLCIVEPGCRVMVFAAALRTHREFLHGSPLPVVRQRLQQGKSWPAASTVDERMQVSAALSVEKLLFAGVADRDVRRDEDLARLLLAVNDGEIRIFPGRTLTPHSSPIRRTAPVALPISLGNGLVRCLSASQCLHRHLQDDRPLGRMLLHQILEMVELVWRPLGIDLDIAAAVGHRSCDADRMRMPVYDRPKADPLNDAIYPDLSLLDSFHSR